MDCEKYLIGLAERVALERPLHTEDQYFLRYSGHMTDELGLFKDCTLAPNMTYHSCQLGVEVLRESLGVCLSNKCSETDWQAIETEFRNYVLKNLSQPENPLSVQYNYTTIYFNPVYPNPVSQPFDDSYTMGFVLLLSLLGIVTIYSTIKGKFIGHLSKEKSEKRLAKKKRTTNTFDEVHNTYQSWDYLEMFDLRNTIKELQTYKISSAGQFTADLLRLLFVLVTFIYQVPFVHAGISKLPVDAVMNAFYNTGAADCNLQLMLFFPDGYLLVSGYICTLAIYRAIARWDTQVSRNPYSFFLLYILLLLKRFLKLGFAIAVGMILVWKIIPLITNGPLSTSNFGCTDHNFFNSLIFWNNNTGGNDNRMCIMWYFYYALDMRLFLFLPPIVFLSVKFKKVAVYLVCLLSATSFFVTFAYNQSQKIREVHAYTGVWIVQVMPFARFHGFVYFLGVLWGIWEHSARNSTHANHKKEHKTQTPQAVVQAEPEQVTVAPVESANSGPTTSLESTPSIKPKIKLRAVKHISIMSRKTSLYVGGVCFSVWLITYLIYSFVFQNDDVLIQNWPQWRHSLFNSLGIPIIGGMLVPAVYGFASAYEKQICKLTSNSIFVSLLSRIYFSLNIIGIPLLLLLLFNLASQPFFDLYLVNYSIIWETVFAVVIAALLQPLIFRPVLACITKLTKV